MLDTGMTSLTLGVPLIIISIAGLLLNGYILIVIVLTKQMTTANNLLLLHLGAVDLLLGILFLFFSAPSLLRGSSWFGPGGPCSFQGFLFTLLHPVALWTVCGLNCDRYYAIASPLHYSTMVSTRKVVIGLVSAWILSFMLCIPPLFFVAPYRYSTSLAGCAPDFGMGPGALCYSLIYTLLTLLLPAALILGCNIKVFMIARYHRHRIASAIFEVTLSAQVTITHQRNPFMPPVLGPPKFKNHNAFSTIFQLLGSLLVLYFPYYGIILWESSTSTILATGHKLGITIKASPHLVILASTLLTCSPPVNGLLYGIKSKILRKTFQNYWRKQMSKSEMNQEIQARTPSACGSRRPSLTPLGFLVRPQLQRRLSEVLLDPRKSGGTGTPRPKIQRIASEQDWRPSSATGLASFFAVNDNSHVLQRSSSCKDQIIQAEHRASSCNTLQVPSMDQHGVSPFPLEEVSKKLKSFHTASISNGNDVGSIEGATSLCDQTSNSTKYSFSSANLFLQRVFGGGVLYHNPNSKQSATQSVKKAAAIQTVLASTPRRSPRILITRAFSEESENTPVNGTPTKINIGRSFSASTTSLLEQKWKKYSFKEPEQNSTEYEDISDNDSSLNPDVNVSSCLLPTSEKESEENDTDTFSSSEDDDSEKNEEHNRNISDDSSGRLYFSLDANSSRTDSLQYDSIVPKQENRNKLGDRVVMLNIDKLPKHTSSSYMLSWPTTRKTKSAVSIISNDKSFTCSKANVTHSCIDIMEKGEFTL